MTVRCRIQYGIRKKFKYEKAIFLVFLSSCLLMSDTAISENKSSHFSGPFSVESDYFNENSTLANSSDSADSKFAEQANLPIEEFSRGNQNWQAYGSIACCDDGKGEMYASHIGYGYFFLDNFSINVDVLGSYIRSDIDNDGAAIGLDLIFRRLLSISQDNLWSLHIEFGFGLQKQSTNYAGDPRSTTWACPTAGRTV